LPDFTSLVPQPLLNNIGGILILIKQKAKENKCEIKIRRICERFDVELKNL
jgi:hypothetical protein